MPLTSCTPRFQRCRCCLLAAERLAEELEPRVDERLAEVAARSCVMTCAASHAFHVASGVVGTIAAKPLKNDGCAMTHSVRLVDALRLRPGHPVEAREVRRRSSSPASCCRSSPRRGSRPASTGSSPARFRAPARPSRLRAARRPAGEREDLRRGTRRTSRGCPTNFASSFR